MKSRIKIDLERLKSVGIKPLEDVGFEYGYNLDHLMNTISDYWLNKYDWKKQEQILNKVLPQFKTQIDGLDIHFAHIKPNSKLAKGKKIIPILMVHGWPGKINTFSRQHISLENS